MSEKRTFQLDIKRQDGPDQPPYWQRFELTLKPGMNVISALQDIAADPVTAEGQRVAAPVWDAGCLEEVCGSCTINMNGRVGQACSTLISDLLEDGEPIVLEPMTKFPVLRDLFVDRTRMFQLLKRMRGWVPIDSTQDLGPGPREDPERQQERYALSRCMTCGCCLEACPQFQQDTNFVGPQAIAQALYFNEHETGSRLKDERLDELMGPGGISDCGQAQNCVKVCPKGVPLTEAIAKIGRQTTRHAFKRFFRK